MSAAARVPGKRILVTGDATGLGAAIVRRLAAERAKLFIGEARFVTGSQLVVDGGMTLSNQEHDQ